MIYKTFLIATGFILMGAGCNYAVTDSVGDLPTTPPDAMMEDSRQQDKDDHTTNGAMESDSAMNKVDMVDDEELMMESDKMDSDDNGHGDTMERLDTDDDDDSVMTGDDKMDSATSNLKPYYIAYTPEVAEAAMKEGRPVVYYFWASWCPICKVEEPQVKSLIEASDLPIAGFRVNYDTESALKKHYKVPYQHTTVFLNSKGVEVERFNAAVSPEEFLGALEKLVK